MSARICDDDDARDALKAASLHRSWTDSTCVKRCALARALSGLYLSVIVSKIVDRCASSANTCVFGFWPSASIEKFSSGNGEKIRRGRAAVREEEKREYERA